jgi:prophage maintenance system killer protein
MHKKTGFVLLLDFLALNGILLEFKIHVQGHLKSPALKRKEKSLQAP